MFVFTCFNLTLERRANNRGCWWDFGSYRVRTCDTSDTGRIGVFLQRRKTQILKSKSDDELIDYKNCKQTETDCFFFFFCTENIQLMFHQQNHIVPSQHFSFPLKTGGREEDLSRRTQASFMYPHFTFQHHHDSPVGLFLFFLHLKRIKRLSTCTFSSRRPRRPRAAGREDSG